MEYLFAYGAGLLTLINRCVLPIFPIVLATSLQSSRHGPLAVAAGMSLTFVVLGILFRVHHIIEAWAIQNLPIWLIDFSVIL